MALQLTVVYRHTVLQNPLWIADDSMARMEDIQYLVRSTVSQQKARSGPDVRCPMMPG